MLFTMVLGPLHGFTAVAELKLELHRLLFAGRVAPPRLHRRGRIEARSRLQIRAQCEPPLHGFTAVAELKPLIGVRRRPAFGPPPRLHRRGRIEASWPPAAICSSTEPLHGF